MANQPVKLRGKLTVLNDAEVTGTITLGNISANQISTPLVQCTQLTALSLLTAGNINCNSLGTPSISNLTSLTIGGDLDAQKVTCTALSGLTSITGLSSLSATSVTGTLQTANQSRITNLGTLGTLSVTGNLNGTINTAAQTRITSLGTLGSLNCTGLVTGTLNTAAQTNITSLGTLGALNCTGLVTGTLNTPSQPNITQLGNLTTGNLTTGTINAGANTITTTSAVTGGTLVGTVRAPNGTTSVPGISFFADTDSGIYRKSENTLGIVTGAAEEIVITPESTTIINDINIQGNNLSTFNITYDTTDIVTTNRFRKIIYNTVLGMYVAIANDGNSSTNKIMTSTDTSSWINRVTGTHNYSGIDFNPVNGEMMVSSTVGSGGNNYLYSNNGTNWTQIVSPTATESYNIKYINNTWYACSNFGTLYTNTGTPAAPIWGVGVTAMASGGSSAYVRDIAWNGSLFVVVGYNNISTDQGIRTSPTLAGGSFTSRATGTNGTDVIEVNWNGNQFIATTNQVDRYVLRSTDGLTWTNSGLSPATITAGMRGEGIAWSIPNRCYALCVSDAGTGQGNLYFSYDGITWVDSGAVSGMAYVDVVYTAHNDRFVVISTNSSGNKIAIVSLISRQNVTSFTGGNLTIGTTGNFNRDLTVNGNASITGNATINGNATANIFRAGLGTQTVPSFSFNTPAAQDCGMFYDVQSNADTVFISTNGGARLVCNAGLVYSNARFVCNFGQSSTSPSLGFSGSYQTTGFSGNTTNGTQIWGIVLGIPVLELNTTQAIIGTVADNRNLTVNGSIIATGYVSQQRAPIYSVSIKTSSFTLSQNDPFLIMCNTTPNENDITITIPAGILVGTMYQISKIDNYGLDVILYAASGVTVNGNSQYNNTSGVAVITSPTYSRYGIQLVCYDTNTFLMQDLLGRS